MINKVFKRTENGYQKPNHVGQKFTMKSRVVPDMSLTPKELLQRYAKGLPLGGYDPNAAMWDDENDGVDIRKLDLVDIQLLQENNLEKLEELKQRQDEALRRGDDAANQQDVVLGQ
jgi:hypothetical protein